MCNSMANDGKMPYNSDICEKVFIVKAISYVLPLFLFSKCKKWKELAIKMEENK